MNPDALNELQASPKYGRFVEFFEDAIVLVMEHLVLQENYDMKLGEGPSVPAVSLGMQQKSLDTLRVFREKMREALMRVGGGIDAGVDAGVDTGAVDADVAEERPESLPLSSAKMSQEKPKRRRRTRRGRRGRRGKKSTSE